MGSSSKERKKEIKKKGKEKKKPILIGSRFLNKIKISCNLKL